MPTYKVTDPSTGQTVSLTGDSPPSEVELNEVFSTLKGMAQPAPEQPGIISSAKKRLANISTPAQGGALRQFSPTLGSALNVAQQAGGFVGDVIGSGIKSGYEALPKDVQGNIAGVGKLIRTNPLVDAAVTGFKSLPTGVQSDLGAVAEASNLIPAAAAGRLIKPAVREGMNIVRDVANSAIYKTPGRLEKELTAVVNSGIDKAIRPTVVGKRTAPQTKAYYEKAKTAVKNIVDNKDNLVLTDAEGNTVQGLPQNLRQFSEAIDQSKKSIYQKYHSMATEAGESGALFDSNTILNKLDDVSVDLKRNPQVREYANRLKSEIEELHGQPPDVIEARIADLNNSLNGFYEGRVSKAKAQVDASVAGLMRSELDNNIMNAVGAGYQDLKNTYGALKSIEKEVNHRAIVTARKNTKGLLDFTDVFTGGEIVGGVLSSNPAMIARGTVGKGIKEYFKFINNPDRMVKSMFSKTENILNKSSVQPGARSALGKFYQGEQYAGPIINGPYQGGLEVGPVKSGVTVGPPFDKNPIYQKQLPVGQGYELKGAAYEPQVIDANFSSSSRPILQLPPGQQQPVRAALPAGQGFIYKDVDYGVPVGEPYGPDIINANFTSRSTPIKGLPPGQGGRLQLPAGQGFELVTQPEIVKPALIKAEEPIGAFARAARERQAQQIINPPTNKKMPEGVIGRIMQDGGIRDNSDYNSGLVRQSADGKRVMRKNGVYTADEWAQILTDEGYLGMETGDKLMQSIESGAARKIYAPEKAEKLFNRDVRRLENEWIEKQLEKEGITTTEIRNSISDHQARFVNEIKSEGLVEKGNIDKALNEVSDFFDEMSGKSKKAYQDVKEFTKGKLTDERGSLSVKPKSPETNPKVEAALPQGYYTEKTSSGQWIVYGKDDRIISKSYTSEKDAKITALDELGLGPKKEPITIEHSNYSMTLEHNGEKGMLSNWEVKINGKKVGIIQNVTDVKEAKQVAESTFGKRLESLNNRPSLLSEQKTALSDLADGKYGKVLEYNRHAAEHNTALNYIDGNNNFSLKYIDHETGKLTDNQPMYSGYDLVQQEHASNVQKQRSQIKVLTNPTSPHEVGKGKLINPK